METEHYQKPDSSSLMSPGLLALGLVQDQLGVVGCEAAIDSGWNLRSHASLFASAFRWEAREQPFSVLLWPQAVISLKWTEHITEEEFFFTQTLSDHSVSSPVAAAGEMDRMRSQQRPQQGWLCSAAGSACSRPESGRSHPSLPKPHWPMSHPRKRAVLLPLSGVCKSTKWRFH